MIEGGEHIARFVAHQLGFVLCPPYTALGIVDNGNVIAGVVVNHFEGCDVHLTVAGKSWTRRFMREVGYYVFRTLDCQRFTVVTEQPEVESLAIRLGGQVEGRLRSHFGYGRDATIIGVLKDEYRWFKTRQS